MKTNKSVMKLCKGSCKRCSPSGHHWEPILTTHNYLQMMRCVHCPAVLGPQEECADCKHDLEDHEFDGSLECLIVVPNPNQDGRCRCRKFVIKALAGVGAGMSVDPTPKRCLDCKVSLKINNETGTKDCPKCGKKFSADAEDWTSEKSKGE